MLQNDVDWIHLCVCHLTPRRIWLALGCNVAWLRQSFVLSRRPWRSTRCSRTQRNTTTAEKEDRRPDGAGRETLVACLWHKSAPCFESRFVRVRKRLCSLELGFQLRAGYQILGSNCPFHQNRSRIAKRRNGLGLYIRNRQSLSDLTLLP